MYSSSLFSRKERRRRGEMDACKKKALCRHRRGRKKGRKERDLLRFLLSPSPSSNAVS